MLKILNGFGSKVQSAEIFKCHRNMLLEYCKRSWKLWEDSVIHCCEVTSYTSLSSP